MINQYPDSDCETKPSVRRRAVPILPKKQEVKAPKEVDLFSENSEKVRLSAKPEILVNLQAQQPC